MILFHAFGHKNIKASHKSTIEFTKDRDVSARGDCILGVNADFDAKRIRESIKGRSRLKCRIAVDSVSDEFDFIPNPEFTCEKEMVFRLGEFASERTIGTRASKAAKHIKREIAEMMKIPGKKMEIVISA